MSAGQHAAGGPGYQPLSPPGRRPRYRGGGPKRGRLSGGFLVALLVLVALVVAAVALYLTSHNLAGHPSAPTTTGPTTTTVPPPPPATARMAPWTLPVPVRDAAAVAGPGGHLLVLGGETGSGQSANGVFTVGLVAGALHEVDALPVAEHDAAAAILGNRVLVFGGSDGTALTAVQAFPLASPTGTTIRAATSAGNLPEARIGAAAVTVGTTCYVLGGYDGATPQPRVLSTKDGHSFKTVAVLPVPVQDAAVAAAGGDLYVFGGSRASATKVVADVQRVDLATGGAAVVAQLPKAVRGANAMTSGPYIYVAGGQGADAGPGTNATVWAFDTADDRVSVAGHLPKPVAYAATSVLGTKEWLVGGESSGTAVAWAEVLSPSRGASGTASTTATRTPARPATSRHP